MSIPGQSFRVLIVDDDPVMRELLTALLSLEGHSVTTVESGDLAVAMLSQPHARFDIILTDLRMPGLEGRKLVNRLNELRGDSTLLIGMSGSPGFARSIGLFDSFLQKPFTMAAFSAAVERAAGHPRGERTEFMEEAADEPATHDTTAAERTAALDESIYSSLSATLPAAQLHELYQLTLRDVGERLERMKAAESSGDRESVRREAHAIKGGCGMVGATELRELAAEIEGGSPGSTPPLADFPAACARLRRILDARLTDTQAK